MELNERQKCFVDYYIKTKNAAEAARLAGYSKGSIKDASHWINPAESRTGKYKPYLKAAIDKRLKELESARIADVTEVLEFFTSAMRGDVKEDVVVVEGAGDGCSQARIITKRLSAHEQLDAAKQLAKRFGLDNAAPAEMDAGPVIIEGEDNIRD